MRRTELLEARHARQPSTDSSFVEQLNINEMTDTFSVPVIYKEEKKRRFEVKKRRYEAQRHEEEESRHASSYQENAGVRTPAGTG